MTKRPVRLTKKQKEIMGLVLKDAGRGTFMNIKELYEKIDHRDKCTYGALRKSLDVLENAGMIVRERKEGSNEKEVKPTLLGYDWFRPKLD